MATLVQGFIKLQLNTGTSGTPTWTNIPGVFDTSGGGQSTNKIDATDYDTPAGTREYIPGIREQNGFQASMHYEQGDATQEVLFTAEAANEPKEFRVRFGTGAGAKASRFSAVPALSLAAPVEGKVTYQLNLEPLAAAVRGSGT